jgi:hypothetical protein
MLAQLPKKVIGDPRVPGIQFELWFAMSRFVCRSHFACRLRRIRHRFSSRRQSRVIWRLSSAVI